MIIEPDVFIARALEFAKSVMFHDGNLIPFFHAEGPHGITVLMMPWRDEDEKTLYLQMSRLSFSHLRVQRYIMVSECWIGPAMSKDSIIEGPVSQMPGRREGIQVSYTDADYREIRTMLMIREGAEEKSKVIDFIEDKRVCGKENLRGRIFDLLPDPKAPIDLATERAVREFLKRFTVKGAKP